VVPPKKDKADEPKQDRRAGLMERMLTENRKRFGDDGCYSALNYGSAIYGVPAGNLALEYLLCSNVIACERIYLLSGARASGKSTLGYELMRKTIGAYGTGTLVETENKTEKSLYESYLQDGTGFMDVHATKTMEDAQTRITRSLEDYPKFFPKNDCPKMIMLDSLYGNRSEETVEAIEKAGHSDRMFPKEAMMISSYFGTLGDKLIGKPIIFMATNHEKKETEGQGYGERVRNPGGAAPDFHASYHIRVSRIENFEPFLDEQGRYTEGYMTKLHTKKCSRGSDKRTIHVPVRWHRYSVEGADGRPRLLQRSWYDWNESLALLLSGDELPKSLTQEIIGVTMVTKKKFNCPMLKLKEAHPSEVGAAIQSDPKMVELLRQKLGIFTDREMTGTP